MRVIEVQPMRSTKKKRSHKILFSLTAFIIVLLGGFLFVTEHRQNNQLTLGTQDQNGMEATRHEGGLKFFSAYDFQKLYDQTAYPNTNQLDELPPITGNPQADNRIRTIAESRGYKAQPTPVQSIVKVEDITDGNANLLQPLARDGLAKLTELANKDKIPLKAKLGYQSIEKQRELFMAKFNAEGLTSEKVTKGEADDKLINVLFAVAPPGYSRHHTGYAIDVTCDTKTSAFELSTCANWLKNNNFEKAKIAGFIPSRVEKIGPPNTDVSTAEYVWVGSNAFYQ